MSRIAASSVGGASRVTRPILWGCGQGFTFIRPCAARLEYSVACVINPLPIQVNLRGAALYCVPCPYKVPMCCHFIGGYLGNPFYAISPHFIPLTNHFQVPVKHTLQSIQSKS